MNAEGWVQAQATLDGMFRPIEDRLVEGATTGRVLDVGCGTGATTLAMARRMGAAGECLGVDIAEPMIAAARLRAEAERTPARFVQADAETFAFEPASFERIVSRFGVMFFSDPVRAFTNLRRAAKDDAELWVATWRSPAENPFMTTAERAAAPILPTLPERRPDEPGQFGLADGNRTRHILEQSGWGDIEVRALDFPCTFPRSELERYFTTLGPLGLVLPRADERTRARIIEVARAAFEPFVHVDQVRFTAACWMVRGTAR